MVVVNASRSGFRMRGGGAREEKAGEGLAQECWALYMTPISKARVIGSFLPTRLNAMLTVAITILYTQNPDRKCPITCCA